MTAAALYASISARGLYQDGVYYLYRIVEKQWFHLADPARTLIQVVRQAPIVFLTRSSDLSMLELGKVFSFVMLMLPVLIACLCWCILPQERKGWIVFPILYLLVGVGATSFNAVGEAMIAASYWWCLLFLLLFRTRDAVSQLIFLGLCGLAFFLHEGAFPLMLVLLACGALRYHRAGSGPERMLLVAVCILLLAIIVYELWWVIDPRDLEDRTRVLDALKQFTYLVRDGHLNLPVLSGALACVVLATILVLQLMLPAGRSQFAAKALAWGFVLSAAVATMASLFVEQSFSPGAQVLARYHPVFVSFGLGLVALFLIAAEIPERVWLRREIWLVIAALAVAQITADVVATSRWRTYVEDLQARLEAHRGPIPWDSMLVTGDPEKDTNWRLMSIEWVIPLMSIAYAKNGVVTSMIDPRPQMTFRPVDPQDPDRLPQLGGVDFSPYKSFFAAPAVSGGR